MKSLYLLFKPTTLPAKTKTLRKLSRQSTETHFISLIHYSKTIKQLRQIHAQILRHKLFPNSRITTQLISASSLLKSVHYSLSIFNHFTPKNSHVFNALIRGLAESSCFQSSISHFIYMFSLGVKPIRLTYPFVLKSAASLCLGDLGRALHGVVVKVGVEFDTFVRVCLVDMYVKVEELGSGFKVFDESPGEINLLWNVLINGCSKVGDMGKAVELFEAMPERNLGSWNSLINGFMRSGDLERASVLFERMPEKNVVSWTTMVSGYSQNGEHVKALAMFFWMLEEGVKANDHSVVTALSASAKVGALEAGLRIHNYISRNGFRLNVAIGNALVDMYAKCGNIEAASLVFDETKEKDIVTWTAMIWGWAIHGHFERAIQCFKEMMYSGIKPDGIVFLAILTAFSYAGQVNMGLNFFDSMRLDYSIEPTMKHYTLIVDMLGRTGRLEQALKFIQRMPIDPDFMIWGTLFCASRAQKNNEMAEFASQRLLQLEPKHPGICVFLSNIYAAAGRWEDLERMRRLMQSRQLEKNLGCSYVEVDGQVHCFVAGDHAHQDGKEIYLKLEEIMTGAGELGYMPGTKWVLHSIEEEEKEDASGIHSEKLALAFSLIRTAPGRTIRIIKNLRVCGDCHSLMKYASKLSQREIVLRDIKRFHHFKDGICSCGDHW
ncbi:hypothetical protein Pint_25482 [Pistacia integerrima]|uniref:Uncharacterized protein n=1 Tax=Pistacia integerrima TaxID=434235 RepID=A0ACC0YI38_9ROSI|nr:hypothetical protein Pint_25482 [Pistacia integerrima]